MKQENQYEYLIFKLGDDLYGFHVEKLKTIEKFPLYRKIPLSPKYIKGLFFVEKEIVSLIDLRVLLGMEEKELDSETRVVIIKDNDYLYGLVVDSVFDIFIIDEKFIDKYSLANNEKASFIDAFARVEEIVIILLKTEKLLEKIQA